MVSRCAGSQCKKCTQARSVVLQVSGKGGEAPGKFSRDTWRKRILAVPLLPVEVMQRDKVQCHVSLFQKRGRANQAGAACQGSSKTPVNGEAHSEEA